MSLRPPRLRVAIPSIVLMVIAVSAAYLYWPQKPQLEQYLSLGQNYDVRILRDTWGVPHVFGKTDPDASFGLAYAHAEDDFLTIQQTLLAARGQLASVYGKGSAPSDYMVGLLRIWDQVDARYETDLDIDSRLVMEAYADGLTYYAAQHPDQVLSPDLFPMTGKDIVAASVFKSPLFFDLDKTLGRLFSDDPPTERSPRPSSGIWSAFDTQYGSNTFAIAPSRTSDGSTYLAVNSHQPWEGPVAWYEAHIHSEEGWDAVGALFPATPVIVHGHNRNLGWAFTVNKSDLTDLYWLEINPENEYQYRFDGQWLNLEVRQVPIKVKLYENLVITVNQEALWSVYGPVVRREEGTYALRYGGFGRVDIFQQLYRMNKAANFEEWKDAMRTGGLPTFNVGYADRDGNIYYLYNGLIPERQEGYDWTKILPGDTSDTLWTETLPFEELPQVLNPPSGFIQNANSTPYSTTLGTANPEPNDFSPTLGIDTRMSNRALRALELFGGDDSITWDEFVAYKFDQSYSQDSDMAQYVRMLSEASSNDPDVAAGLEILRSWDLKLNAESTAATLAVTMLQYFPKVDRPIRTAVMAETYVSQQDLMDAFTQAVHTVKEKYGRLEVPWSEANRLIRGSADLGLGGGPDVLNAVYGKLQEDGRFMGYQGDSYVLLARWDSSGEVTSFSIHQYGSATLDAASPHYADQSALFVNQELKPVWFDEAEIRANLEQEYTP